MATKAKEHQEELYAFDPKVWLFIYFFDFLSVVRLRNIFCTNLLLRIGEFHNEKINWFLIAFCGFHYFFVATKAKLQTSNYFFFSIFYFSFLFL